MKRKALDSVFNKEDFEKQFIDHKNREKFLSIFNCFKDN